MFFSSELLAKRDSGFGLLWLAATLGSKFKKLPKRSVLTADISQLCGLITEPAEPLALRLSSCLMVGVARVYKVKQEIFMADVTNCVTSLKKVVQEIQSVGAHIDLQMAQPTVRSSALTLRVDPKIGGAIMDFDVFVADWDEYLNIKEQEMLSADSRDDEFDPSGPSVKHSKQKKAPSMTEDIRADNCTLKEHHDHLLSASFDLSFSGSGSFDPSSQADPAFSLDDILFPPGDEIDLGSGLADELAKELGEGWGGSPQKNKHDVDMDAVDLEFENHQIDLDFNFGVRDSPAPSVQFHPDTRDVDNEFIAPETPSRKRKAPSKENLLPTLSPAPSVPTHSPANSFSRLLLSQDSQSVPLRDVTPINQVPPVNKAKKLKRTRLLLDARTELTDEELKIARAEYSRRQDALRSELNQKKSEKDTEKFVEDIIWGVPRSIQAPDLVDFWQENFKVQVEARTGILHIYAPDEPLKKRRKTKDAGDKNREYGEDPQIDVNLFDNAACDIDMIVPAFEDNMFGPLDTDYGLPNFRSSEEPGQGRQNSRPPSILSKTNFGLDFGTQDPLPSSQRSSLFPWDNAAAESSSSGFAGQLGSDQIVVDRADTGMRGSSLSGLSGQDSPSIPGRAGSAIGLSPGNFVGNSQLIGEDYEFEVAPLNYPTQSETQQSDANLITLERNSFNFLEYTKMQQNTLPDLSAGLSFDIIVPTATSTRHVAAAAFYHCLVLATKDMLRLKQPEPYGPLSIVVIA